MQIPVSSPNLDESRFMNPLLFCHISIKIHTKNWTVKFGFRTETGVRVRFFKNQISP